MPPRPGRGNTKKKKKHTAAERTVPGAMPLQDTDTGPQMEEEDPEGSEGEDVGEANTKKTGVGEGNETGVGAKNDADAGKVNDADVGKGNDVGVGKGNDAGAGEGHNAGEGEGNGRVGSGAKDNSANRANDAEISNASEAPPGEVTGLKELIQVIETLGSTAVGEQLVVDPGLLDKLRGTPLYPAYEALELSWKKMLVHVSETEAGRVPLPLSPPLTPKEGSRISTQGPQNQPQQTSQSSPKGYADKEVEAQQPQTQQASHSPSKVYTDREIQAEPQKFQESSHPPPKVYADQEVQAKPSQASSLTQPTQVVPPWDGKELKTLEAEITSLSSKLDFMSQTMSKMASKQDITGCVSALGDKLGPAVSRTAEEVKTTGNTTKTRVEKVDNTVSQMSTKLDGRMSTLQQSVKQLQDAVSKKPASVVQNPQPESRPESRLDPKTGELEAQVSQLHQVLEATRVELLQADIAFKVAFEGSFSEEAETAETSGDAPNKAGSNRDAAQIARGIRTNTLRLISRCRALFSLIAGNSDSSDTTIMGGEWAKCVEHIQTRDLKVRKAIKEKEEAARELQFFRFLVDQIRRGFYVPSEWKLALNGQDFAGFMDQPYDGFASIQLLAQEMYRLQHSRPKKPSSPSKPKYEESRKAPPTGWAAFSSTSR